MLYQRATNKSLEQIDAGLRAAAAKHQFGVIAVHDLGETLRNKGVDFRKPCIVYEVCNPQQAKKVLESDGAFSTVLPCRISVYESAGAHTIATVLPTALVDLFHNPELEPVARDVETTLKEMIEETAA